MPFSPVAIPSATGFTGAHSTSRDANAQIRHVRRTIAKVLPNEAPFYALLQKLSRGEMLKARKFEWYKLAPFKREVTVTEEESASGTSFTVDDTSMLAVDSILQDPVTREQIKVSAIGSATAFTSYTRGLHGGGTPAIITAGTKLYVMHSARIEGGSAQRAVGISPESDYNYYQQFEMCSATTDLMKFVRQYGIENASEFEDANMIVEYKKRMEAALLFGYRATNAAGTSGAGTYGSAVMGGLQDYIRTDASHVVDVNGAFTHAEFDEVMQSAARFAPGSPQANYWLLCGAKVRGIIGRWGVEWHQFDATKTKTLGFEFTRFTGHGYTANVLYSMHFDYGQHQNELYALNLDEVSHIMGISEQMNREITGPKNDGSHLITNQMTGVSTLEVANTRCQAIFHNITS
jgi:hypothetical protein